MSLSGSGSTSGAGSSWWRPPGAMDVSDGQLSRASFASSTSFGVKKPATSNSRLRVAVHEYLTAPSSDSLANLHQLTRKLTSEIVFFSRQLTALALRLLDTFSEHLLSIAQAAEETQSQAPFAVEVHELLELVYLFIKNTPIGYPSHALGKLLQWLVAGIVTSGLSGTCENETTLKLQLLVVAEVLKANAGVRIYAKEMKKVKEFYRALTILLNSTEDAELLVFSMTILGRLVLTESLGAKLFSQKNVDQAFELVFSILDGSWQDNTRTSGRSSGESILNAKTLLQCVGVDLVCELADRPEILSMLEKHAKMEPVVENFFMVINLNGDAEQIQVGIHFLSSLLTLGHQFRKIMIKFLSDEDVLYRVLQVTLHPSRMIGILTTQLVLRVIGEDLRPIQSLFESPSQVQKLGPVIAGLLRCINEASGIVQQTESFEELSTSEEYLHAVEVCQVLGKLCEFPLLRSACVQTISLNQSAALIQLESAQLGSGEPQSLLRFQPRLSLNLVIVLSKLVNDPNMLDKAKRTLNQFLQSPEVSLVLGAGVFNRSDKDMVVETLLLFHNLFLESTSNKRFVALGLAEGILNFGQRIGEATETLQSAIASLEANGEASRKVIEKLQTEIQQTLRLQDEVKAKQDQELQSIKSKFVEQVRQKDELMMKTRDMYEAKLRELNAQCEAMGQLMNKKISNLQHRDQLLQENRGKQARLEDENAELKRKVEVLEIRIEEIAHSHSIAAEEIRIREHETSELREEMATISSDYTAQREELEVACDNVKKLEQELSDKTFAHENTYKELVLLSKAHKALLDEKEELSRMFESTRDELANLESLNSSIQSRLQERKDLAEQLERKIARLEDASSVAQSALEDERDKRRAVARDLEDLRKAYRKLESDIAMFEIRAAEQRLLLESRDDHLRKCEEEIRHLNNEVGKQVKLQALIHQLSSGGDAHSFAASSFLARDS